MSENNQNNSEDVLMNTDAPTSTLTPDIFRDKEEKAPVAQLKKKQSGPPKAIRKIGYKDNYSSSSSDDDISQNNSSSSDRHMSNSDSSSSTSSADSADRPDSDKLDSEDIQRLATQSDKTPTPTVKDQLDKIMINKYKNNKSANSTPEFEISDSSDDSSSESEEIPLEAQKRLFQAGRDQDKLYREQKQRKKKGPSNNLGFEDGNTSKRYRGQKHFEDDFDEEMDDEAAMYLGEAGAGNLSDDPPDIMDEDYDDFTNLNEDSSGENEAGLGFVDLIRGSARNDNLADYDEDEEEDSDNFGGFSNNLGTSRGKSLGTRQFQSKRVILDQFGIMNQRQQQSGSEYKNQLLPTVNKQELEQINDALMMAINMPQNMKLKFCHAVKDKNFKFIQDLHTIYQQLYEKRKEEQSLEQTPEVNKSLNTDRLTTMATIFKGLILLGDAPLTDQLLSDKYYMTTFGALELLPEIYGKLNCTEFFEKVQFKQVIPITNKNIVNKIHICYRANYLRETIFAKDDGPAPQSLAFLNFNHTIEIMTNIFNNFQYLRQIVHAAQHAPQIEQQSEAIQFLLDLVTQFKTYQQCLMQMIVTPQPNEQGVKPQPHSVPDLLVHQLDTFQIVMKFFQNDKRVELACEMAFPDEQTSQTQAPESPHSMPDSPVKEQMSKTTQEILKEQQKMHPRHSDQTIYDTILAHLIEILNILLNTMPKETVKKFIEDGQNLTMVLAQHVFFAPEEILRSQILELFKTLLDLSGAGKDSIQFKIEQMLVRALLKPFLMLLNRGSPQTSPNKPNIFSNEDRRVSGILVGKDFNNQTQQIFELMQLMCKPQINSLVVEPRTGVTQVMIQFIKEFNLPTIALGVFYHESNDNLTRMMALKFFKSLFALEDKEILIEMCKADPIQCAIPTLMAIQYNQKNINMFQSSVLDLFNIYGLVIYKTFGPQFHDKMLNTYAESIDWSQGLIDKFFYPAGKRQTPAKRVVQTSKAKLVAPVTSVKTKQAVLKNSSFVSASAMICSKDNVISMRELMIRDFGTFHDMQIRQIEMCQRPTQVVESTLINPRDEEFEEQEEWHVPVETCEFQTENNEPEEEEFVDASTLSQQMRNSAIGFKPFKFVSKRDEKLPIQQAQPTTSITFVGLDKKSDQCEQQESNIEDSGTWSDGDTEPDELMNQMYIEDKPEHTEQKSPIIEFMFAQPQQQPLQGKHILQHRSLSDLLFKPKED